MEIDREAVVQCFLAESEEGLSAMEEALVVLETRPADAGLLHDIFRIAHSLKGNASALDFSGLTEFAHAMEDLLEKVRDHKILVTPIIVGLLLRSIDTCRRMVKQAVKGALEMEPAAVKLMQQLQAAAANQLPAQAVETEQNTAKPEPETSTSSRKTLRVDLQKLDRMIDLSGEIAIARGRLDNVLERGIPAGESLEVHRESDLLYAELQELVMKLRMVPIGPVFHRFNRIVRDLARSQRKVVRVCISGEDVELDTRVIELIRDPLIHLVRNAVDHGLELPEVRNAQGKPPCGTITLRALHSAGNVLIQVSDDGAGFNQEQILKCARQHSLIAEGEKLSEQEIYKLVFQPGFSTSEVISDVSGRGVGMDIVRRNIDGLRGSISIDSREGQGATVTLRIPLTLAIIDAFSVAVGEETYVIPLDSIVECLELPPEQQSGNGAGVVEFRGEPLPYLRLRNAFDLGGPIPPRQQIVVIKHDAGTVGLAVDSLLGATQAVIKPLGTVFQAVPGISGSTILGNGRVALILDVHNLVREAIRHQVQVANT